ncbi:Uncharacterised protein (plasmid) [Tsukamurella tyrosinosolvens]|uniref:Uncharacterized protein n=1 Tax=Tsukamurella tyrosinosolvens TaxID=57704 RepID=A0A1H4U8H1_TSUTY|nr:hypothetical protein [Tsukamurella tyrosinosolvens]KXO93007.1 hypothetical protein AXK58_14145 [Tsukamurella tyrosinosolvens]SEC64581.1 hypothetical protein SAMN04489793_2802 [Tsukamurella tyrosinosolvens]VEH94032.1 Uncharacterised protein [Tsukamurella tyrosinosolvens]
MPRYEISHPQLPGSWCTDAADPSDARVVGSTAVITTLRVQGLATADTTLADVADAIVVRETQSEAA